MPRTADHDAASPATAPVLTPDGQRWLLERAAWLAAEPDQAGWSDDTYARGQPSWPVSTRSLPRPSPPRSCRPSSPVSSSSATRS